MASEATEPPEVVKKEGEGKAGSRWSEFLTPISIGIAAIGLIINFVLQFQSQIKDDVKGQVSSVNELTNGRIKNLQDDIAKTLQITNEHENRIRAMRADLDERSAQLNVATTSLKNIQKYIPQSGLSFAPIPVAASDENCRSVIINDNPDQTHQSHITSICTIPKEALRGIPEDARIVAAVMANSHYNLRLTANRIVGSLDISEIAKSQPPNDRGSEGHAETIITLNDVTRQGGTFFVSRPFQEGWSPHSDSRWVWIGTILIYYVPQ